MRSACTGCPAFNYQENGAEDVKSEYVCDTTNVRWKALEAVRAGLSVEAALERAGAGAEHGPEPPKTPRFKILPNSPVSNPPLSHTKTAGCGSSCGCGD